MIVICTKDYRDESGILKNRKSHVYQAVFETSTLSYLIESEKPNKIGSKVTEELFEKNFRVFVP